MRISFIVDSFPALSETFILNQMTGLMDSGCEIRIFAGARSSEKIVHEDVVRHGLLYHVQYWNERPASVLGRILKFIFIFPIHLTRSPRVILRSINVFAFGREAWSLELFYMTVAFLAARADDIIICHLRSNGLIGIKMKQIGALTGKIVTVFHIEDLADLVKNKTVGALEDLFLKGDLFLPVSRYAQERLLELGCPPRKIVVHRMGVDVRQFDVSARRRFGSTTLKILSVARLIDKKGIAYALEALALLENEPFEYVIIGDGPLREMLEMQARSFGLMHKVRFLGWQDSGAIRRYLKDADIFLAPSVTTASGDKEGIPVVLMEAMASGVPVVTTSNGAIRELVEDGRTGFLVPEKNAAALAAKLRILRQDPAVADAASRAARRLIEEQFNIQILNQHLLRILTQTAYENA
ncbi:MAG: glycosyltransferase [Candidatus Omnitrophica bacterium]|nr:glycosyltransferase [Candidatus Omnitrophota bacterium]